MLQDEKIVKIRKAVKKALPKERYQHTLGVAYTAACLAMKYGVDTEKAYLAGLLHDCAKGTDPKDRARECRKFGLTVTPVEERVPELLHPKLGACYAEKRYGVTDPEILNAVTYHTTGRPAMSLLEKIIYIADYIEPNRTKQPNLTALRKLAFEDLDRALVKIIDQTVSYVREKYPENLDEMSLQAYQYYLNQTEENEWKRKKQRSL